MKHAGVYPTSICGALFFVSLSTSAHAGVTGLFYDADSSCPNREAFIALVGERAPSMTLEPSGPTEADVVVRLRGVEDGASGRLEIRRPGESAYVREIHGDTCEEVAPAVAFVTALALKGQSDEPLPEVRPAPPNPPPQPNEQPVPRTSLFDHWAFGVAGELGIRGGLAPIASPTEQISIEMRSRDRSIVSPIFRLALLHAEPVTRVERFGTTRFTFVAGRAAACPIRFVPLAFASILPCAGIDTGAISASGTPAAPTGTPRTSSSVWFDVFASLRAELHVVGPVFVTGQAELVVPATPYRFAFDPNTPVYDIPSLQGAASGGLVVQFP